MSFKTSRAGFSLVELSIVLVIIGLLVGGILAGRSLIRAAELRGIATEYQQWEVAISMFRNEYDAIPGDMANATQFWPAKNANNVTCLDMAVTTGTCNGNGDGIIQEDVWTWVEDYLFWQHLAMAGHVSSSYTGTMSGTAPITVIGTNVPASKVKSGGWSVMDAGHATGAAFWGDTADFYRNALVLGAAEAGRQTGGAVLTPEEAYSIDSKLDDGKPARGAIRALNWSGCTDAANRTAYGAEYRVSSPAVSCAMRFSSSL